MSKCMWVDLSKFMFAGTVAGINVKFQLQKKIYFLLIIVIPIVIVIVDVIWCIVTNVICCITIHVHALTAIAGEIKIIIIILNCIFRKASYDKHNPISINSHNFFNVWFSFTSQNRNYIDYKTYLNKTNTPKA